MSKFGVFCLVVVILFGCAYLVAGRMEAITSNQAAVAHEVTAQVQVQQQYATERWEAFLLTLKALTLPAPQPFSLLSFLLGLVCGPVLLIAYATAGGSQAGAP